MGIALSNGLRETPAVLVFLGGLALGLVASACGLLLLVPAWDSGVEWALEHGKFFPPWRSTIGGALAIVGVTTGGVLLPIIVILSR
jgi:hypothetical protein